MPCIFREKCRKAGFLSTMAKYRNDLCQGTISEIENCYNMPIIRAKLRDAGVD